MSAAGRIVIRYLVGSAEDVVALISKENCWLYSLEARRVIVALPLPSDCDGRVAFSTRTDLCVVGGWESGLSCYRISDGKQIWRNRKARKFTRIAISESDNLLFLSETEPPGAMLVNLQNGNRVAIDAERRQAFYDSDGVGRVVLNQDKELIFENGSESVPFRWGHFAVLSGCFGNGRFAATSPGGEVVCYETATGHIMGSMPGRPTFFNCRPIAFNRESNSFVGLAFDYSGTGCALVDFGKDCKSVTLLAKFPNVWSGVFLNGGMTLLTTSGEVWNCTTGELISSVSWESLTLK